MIDGSNSSDIASLRDAVRQLEIKVHRLEHTITSTQDVGHKVLQAAKVDGHALFLPSMPASACVTQSLIDNLPAEFQQSLEAAVKESASSSLRTIDEHSADSESKLNEDANDEKSLSVRKQSEALLQRAYNILFPYLLQSVHSCLQYHDTSVRNYLQCPTGKIDITLTASNVVSWPTVISLAELKANLRSKPAYEEAIGQVVQRCSSDLRFTAQACIRCRHDIRSAMH